ncbi:unnamed protein product [Caenorhabditis brenneri]
MWTIFLVFLVFTQVHADFNDEASHIFQSLVAQKCENQTEQKQFDYCYDMFEDTLSRQIPTLNGSELLLMSLVHNQLVWLDWCIRDAQCLPHVQLKFILQGNAYSIEKLYLLKSNKCTKRADVPHVAKNCSDHYTSLKSDDDDEFVAMYHHRDDIVHCIVNALNVFPECDEFSRQQIAAAGYSMIDVLAAFSPEINKDNVFVFDRFKYENITLAM